MAPRYSSSEDKKSLLPEDDRGPVDTLDEEQEFLVARRSRQSTLSLTVTVLNILILVGTAWLFYLTTSKAACHSIVSDQDHYRATSAYSPILDRFEIPKITHTINGSLYDGTPPSILRDTGKAGDDEWFRIGTGVFPIVVSSKEILTLGKDPAQAVKIPEKHGYGPDAYIAQTDVFHHLHCVDMLRQDIYHPWNHRTDAEKKSSDTQHWAHVGHCLDILAQAIKCSGSVDMIMFNWVEGWDQPFPDFATQKTCRNFEALLGWVNDNSIPHEVFQEMKEPPAGYAVLPEPSPMFSR